MVKVETLDAAQKDLKTKSTIKNLPLVSRRNRSKTQRGTYAEERTRPPKPKLDVSFLGERNESSVPSTARIKAARN
jgi:hypothetical protein